MGWTPASLPIDKLYFSKMCDALNGNGYDPDRAAALWNRAFRQDMEARKELRANTGLYGMTVISEDGQWH
jgi:hypothetical protein